MIFVSITQLEVVTNLIYTLICITGPGTMTLTENWTQTQNITGKLLSISFRSTVHKYYDLIISQSGPTEPFMCDGKPSIYILVRHWLGGFYVI